MNKIKYWWTRPAKWHQFWFPQSGLPGGLIFGILVGACIVLGFKLV